MLKLKDYIMNIPNFPKAGIMFRDITPLLQNENALQFAVNSLCHCCKETDFDIIISPESRGFIFGVPMAYAMQKSFVPVRKKGKLPRTTIEQTYDLEYGTETLEIHSDAIYAGQKVVIVDDLLATGGTIKAIIDMVEKLGGEVTKICCLLELSDLNGRKNLKGYDVSTVIVY